MIPEARLIHAVPGRFRFKIPAMRRDERYFAALAAEIPKLSGVVSVRANALSCSLLVRCHPDMYPEAIAQFAAERQLFLLDVTHSPLLAVLSKGFEGLQYIDRRLQTPDGKRYDKRALLLLVLVTLAVRQTLRGEIMVPALTLWWNAYLLLEQMGPRQAKPSID